NCLDPAVEVKTYENENQKRLELLKGKIDANRYRAIANRFSAAVRSGQGAVADESPQPATDNEPTVLEDFMLQAEIFLQYSMRSKAVERLQRIQKLFPREEDRNEKLRSLYMNAGMMPKYDDAPPPKAATPPPVPATQRVVPATVALTNPIAMAPQGPTSVANE